ncbi:MAG: hypothetical protein WBZ36_09265 [Candidatus Nitrosopolaris sp.]
MLIYITTGGKLEIMNQISNQFDIFSKDPLLKESLRRNFKRLSRKDQLELLKIFHDAKVMLKQSDQGDFSSIFKIKIIEHYPPSS